MLTPNTVARIRGKMDLVANGVVKSTYVTPRPELRTTLHGAAKQGDALEPKNTAVGNGKPPPQLLTGVLAKIAGTKAKRIRNLNIFITV